ncbi:MAG: hypothetical protein JRN67_13215, partial [Nitrososphaerota archaeon]|nr:hypothetical protein [Nitrososphaerota archaeon]
SVSNALTGGAINQRNRSNFMNLLHVGQVVSRAVGSAKSVTHLITLILYFFLNMHTCFGLCQLVVSYVLGCCP